MAQPYEHPRPALTVDCVVFGLDVEAEELRVLLIERGIEPFKGRWAVPGGFVIPGESVDDAAGRELYEETGLSDVFLEQLYTFGAPDRDPREHVVTVAYYALVNLNEHPPTAGSDASSAEWYEIGQIPSLAFDHDSILNTAINRLRGSLRYRPIGFELMPEKFSLTQLQRMYEIILGQRYDKRNFRKKILGLGVLEELDEIQKDVRHRAAKLYRFDKEAYQESEEKGVSFEI